MEQVLQICGEVIRYFQQHILMINLLFAIIVVFFERKSPKSVWAWLLLLYFIPGLGFVLYLLLGANMRKSKMFRIKEVEDHLHEAIRQQEYSLRAGETEKMDQSLHNYTDLVLYNMKTSGAILTEDNDIDIFTDGSELYDKMLEDMAQATKFIHIQYYNNLSES